MLILNYILKIGKSLKKKKQRLSSYLDEEASGLGQADEKSDASEREAVVIEIKSQQDEDQIELDLQCSQVEL